ncbi:MAG: permease-like cell division protein FtsX [Actinomycetota bacterium]
MAGQWSVAVAAAVLLGGCGLFSDDVGDERARGAVTGTAMCAEPNETTEAIVWLDATATDAEVETIDRLLGTAPKVVEHRYVDRDATYAEFEEFFADEPDIIELVEPENLPTSFRVYFDQRLLPQLVLAPVGGAPSFDSIEPVIKPNSCKLDPATLAALCDVVGKRFVIWIDPSATSAEVDVIGATLRATPSLADIRYIDRDETWESFATFFADEPDVLAAVDRSQLPTSFEATVVEGGQLLLGAELTAFPAIQSIDFAVDPELCWS